MNFIKMLETLSDKDALNSKMSRRGSLSKFGSTGKNIALASIPFALAATSTKTRAATMNMVSAAYQADSTAVLNFALTLEYLEKEFYNKGLDSGIIAAEDKTVFETISRHEDEHVAFLLGALGEDAVPKPTFDFSAGLGLKPFEDYATFMALAQGFEDTGVRAYKGQAGNLMATPTLLTYALQIHSVEARHASEVRRLRGEKGWITQNDNTLPPDFAGIYAGEQNTTQLEIDLAGMFDEYGGADAVTEAFDEPLTMDEVLAIGGLFIVADDSDSDS